MTICFNPECGACTCTAGNDFFLAGTFDMANGLSRAGVLRITSAGAVTSFIADVGVSDPGTIALAYDSANDLLYMGGEFATINGTARNCLACVNGTTGAVTSWNPNPNGGIVADILIHNSLIYYVGDFTTVGGTGRNRAACSNAAGTLQAWNPNCNDFAEVLVGFGTSIYIGGMFTTINGSTRHGLAAIHETTAAVSAWDPAPDASTLGSPPGSFPAEIFTICITSAHVVFVGGYFNKIGGAAGTARDWMAGIDINTGAATAFNANIDASPYDIAEDGLGNLIISGDFLVINGQSRNNAARINTSGIAIGPDFGFGTSGFGRSLMVHLGDTADTFYFGGRFYDPTNTVRAYVHQFADDGATPVTTWDPDLNAEVYRIVEVV